MSLVSTLTEELAALRKEHGKLLDAMTQINHIAEHAFDNNVAMAKVQTIAKRALTKT